MIARVVLISKVELKRLLNEFVNICFYPLHEVRSWLRQHSAKKRCDESMRKKTGKDFEVFHKYFEAFHKAALIRVEHVASIENATAWRNTILLNSMAKAEASSGQLFLDSVRLLAKEWRVWR